MVFMPTYAFNSVTDISVEFLKRKKIRGLLLDLDNTLTTHDNPVPAEKVADWIAMMKENGIRLIIVSNNTPQRARPFGKGLKLPVVPDGKKPLANGFIRARDEIRVPFSKIAIVGDQIFTDIVGANFIGVRSIYVKPIELETTAFFKFKRLMEKLFLHKIEFEK